MGRNGLGRNGLYIFIALLSCILFCVNISAQDYVSANATVSTPVSVSPAEKILAPDAVAVATPGGLKSIDLPAEGVVVLFFFQTIHCPDCLVIEAIVEDLLDVDFEDAISDSLIFWQTIDFELAENKNFQLAYELDETAIVLSRRASGKEVDWVMLTEIWDMVEDTIPLADYIRFEIEMFLDEEES